MSHYQNLDTVEVFTEPVEKWRNLEGHNLLQLMYQDPERHSYTFQSYVQLTMTQLHTAKTNKPIKFIERSLWSQRYVFAENLLKSGKMAASEFEVLNSWFEFLQSNANVDLGIDLIIYLRTTPEVAYQRLKARSRSEEKIVSIDYLKDLHELYEAWLVQEQTNIGGAKVVVIDANKDIKLVPQVYSEHQDTIFEAMSNKKADNDDIVRPKDRRSKLAKVLNPLQDVSHLDNII